MELQLKSEILEVIMQGLKKWKENQYITKYNNRLPRMDLSDLRHAYNPGFCGTDQRSWLGSVSQMAH
jgi:hypothetical protein